MSAVNMMNNNVQFNPYTTSLNVRSTEVEMPKGVQTQADNNASINEYGDEFVRSSIIKNEDGAVYSKPTNSDDLTARVPEEEELPKIDSLIGYTTSQVQQLYYEGRVSRYDYDTKMEQKSELLQSEGAIASPEEVRFAEDKADEAKRVEAREAIAKDTVKVDEAKAEVNKAEANKADTKKADDTTRQENASRKKVYEDSKDLRQEIMSEEQQEAKVLNNKMSVIGNEQRDNEEFEIIESGNDAAATFKLVQNLNNLGSGVEGGTWNIA
jgi:hypothetical protein